MSVHQRYPSLRPVSIHSFFTFAVAAGNGWFYRLPFLDLALLGLGLSLVNFALRGHIIARVKDKKSQAALFALVTMTANLGSAIGPLASNYIYKAFGQTLFVIVIVGLYVFLLY